MSMTASFGSTKWKKIFQDIEGEFSQLISQISPTIQTKDLDLTDAKIKELLEKLKLQSTEIDKHVKKSRGCCYCLNEKSIAVILCFTIFQTVAQTAGQAYDTFGKDMTSKTIVLGFNALSNTLMAVAVIYGFAASMLQGHRSHVSELIKEAITQTEKFEELIAILKEIRQQNENSSLIDDKLSGLLSLERYSSQESKEAEILQAIKEQNQKNAQMDEKINKLLEAYRNLPLEYKLGAQNDRSNLSEIVSYGVHHLPTDDPIKKDLEEVTLPETLGKVYLATEKTKNWDGEKGSPGSPEKTSNLVANIFAKINERFNVEIDYIHSADGNMLRKDSFNLQRQESSELKVLIEK